MNSLYLRRKDNEDVSTDVIATRLQRVCSLLDGILQVSQLTLSWGLGASQDGRSSVYIAQRHL